MTWHAYRARSKLGYLHATQRANRASLPKPGPGPNCPLVARVDVSGGTSRRRGAGALPLPARHNKA